MFTEKTVIKITVWTVVIILGLVITWSVAAATWKVNFEQQVNTNTISIDRIDIAQHEDEKERILLKEMVIETNTNVKWIMQYMEEQK